MQKTFNDTAAFYAVVFFCANRSNLSQIEIGLITFFITL